MAITAKKLTKLVRDTNRLTGWEIGPYLDERDAARCNPELTERQTGVLEANRTMHEFLLVTKPIDTIEWPPIWHGQQMDSVLNG